MFHIFQNHRILIYICVFCGNKFLTVREHMKMRTDKEEKFKDESNKDVIKTKNKFKKSGRKEQKRLITTIYTHASHAWSISHYKRNLNVFFCLFTRNQVQSVRHCNKMHWGPHEVLWLILGIFSSCVLYNYCHPAREIIRLFAGNHTSNHSEDPDRYQARLAGPASWSRSQETSL